MERVGVAVMASEKLAVMVTTSVLLTTLSESVSVSTAVGAIASVKLPVNMPRP